MDIHYTMDADVVMEALLAFNDAVSWAAEEDVDNGRVVVGVGLDRDPDCSAYFTPEELQSAVDAVLLKNKQLEYASLRKAAYDNLNQFEMQFDDAANNTTTWVDAVNAIKLAYPKEVTNV